jgi:crossover junction endodeoxyribonuclease RusA
VTSEESTLSDQTYVLVLPWTRPPITANQRLHWSVRSRLTGEIRSTVAWLARAAKIPSGRHLTVELVWAPGDRRRRDADNPWPTLKACCDALARGRADLIGLDLVPDDTPEYMEKLPPRIVPPPHAPGMWLMVTVRS